MVTAWDILIGIIFPVVGAFVCGAQGVRLLAWVFDRFKRRKTEPRPPYSTGPGDQALLINPGPDGPRFYWCADATQAVPMMRRFGHKEGALVVLVGPEFSVWQPIEDGGKIRTRQMKLRVNAGVPVSIDAPQVMDVSSSAPHWNGDGLS